MGKSYPATVAIHGRIFSAPWPLGRVQVTDREVRVRSPLAPWVSGFDVDRADVIGVTLTRSLSGVVEMRLKDRLGVLDDVRIQLPLFSGKLLRKLTEFRYPVAAQDRWLSLRNSRQKRGWSAPSKESEK